VVHFISYITLIDRQADRLLSYMSSYTYATNSLSLFLCVCVCVFAVIDC